MVYVVDVLEDVEVCPLPKSQKAEAPVALEEVLVKLTVNGAHPEVFDLVNDAVGV